MTDASVTTVTTPHSSIVAAEAAHFGQLAQEWWDPKGSSAMLHRLNPVRLRYLRGAIDRHWDLDDAGFTPLAGRRALDMGCGAGLLAEPLADANPPAGDWQPMEFLVAVDPMGLVGPPTLTESSRVAAVDGYFQNYLVKTLHAGQRLAPGFYRICIGP